MNFRIKGIVTEPRLIRTLTRDFRTDKKCLGGCGKNGTVPLFTQDKWGTKYLRGYACYTCYTTP